MNRARWYPDGIVRPGQHELWRSEMLPRQYGIECSLKTADLYSDFGCTQGQAEVPE